MRKILSADEIQITYDKTLEQYGEEQNITKVDGKKCQTNQRVILQQKQKFYNDHNNGTQLIQNIIDVIRHQQFVLDNMDHLKEFNGKLLGIWKMQINLLDRYDRFNFYKLLGRLKQLMLRLQKLNPMTIEELLLKNNENLMERMKELIQLIIKDCSDIELDVEKSNKDGVNKKITLREAFQFVKTSKGNQADEDQKFLENILRFIVNTITFNYEEKEKKWMCKLCGWKQQKSKEFIEHIEKQHLKCLSSLLLGGNDKCFSLSCSNRQGNRWRKNYNIGDHLKTCHSQIFNEDKIFCKLYKISSTAEQHFYGYHAKNWKKKFEDHLEEWLENIDPGSEQFIQDIGIFGSKRGEGLLNFIRGWFETDEGIKKCEVSGGSDQFDQLCYFLKMSWSTLGDFDKQEVQEINWIYERLIQEPRRIFMIETFAELLDTKLSLFAQLHRYLYLGVFNFKQCQAELFSRIQGLDNYIKQLGIFQAYLFNSENFREYCIFEGVLCLRKNAAFQFPLVMYEHYYDAHLGVFYSLSDDKLQVIFKEFKRNQIFERRMGGQLFFNIFEELELGEFIHFLHDYFSADYKTRTRWFIWNARKNFQLKCICCDCKKELYHFGEVNWKENQEGGQKQQLIFRHNQTVAQVIQVYKERDSDKSEMWSELNIIKDQCEIFKRNVLEQMRSEILIDDKGRKSRCKECHKKLKGFNPLLKELKEEYFRLPLEDQEEAVITQEQNKNQQQNARKLKISDEDPRFIKVQKQILNRMIEGEDGLAELREQMQGGYFRINSFPKLVQIYGEISESVSQNSRRVISQPILSGYMKVLFQTPLIYIPGTSIIYEMQPQWAKVRHQFKLFGTSELQRKEYVQMLEEHPIIQNHTYQMTKLTQLCINQVDLIFKLNKHLIKSTGKLSNQGQIQQEKLGQELCKTSDLLYFEGVLHRAQVSFLIQQFKIWADVYENVKLRIEEVFQQENKSQEGQINKLEFQFNSFNTSQTKIEKARYNFSLMMILSFFYCEAAYKQQNLENQIKFFRGLREDDWNFLDFIFNEQQQRRNNIRFYVQSHLLPILTPIVEQYIHPIFIGVLLQIFQLNYQRAEVEVGQEATLFENQTLLFYLNVIYNRLSNLTIKRCIPLFTFGDDEDYVEEGSRRLQQRNQQNLSAEQMNKLKRDGRIFQLKLFVRLDQQQQIDMQCRYVLAKRSLLKVMYSKKEDPPIECDLRWAMQIAQMFFSSIRKRSRHGNDDEMRVAKQNVQELKDLKEEADHYFHKNRSWIPEDFLFKTYKQKKNKQNGNNVGQEQISDLRSLLEEILKEDQGAQLNQTFNQSGYKVIHKLKIAFFIPMEKKLQDIVGCIAKLRSLPHRQTYRSFEKFHRYNFRELEMLAFPELFATGQGFQQYLAPTISRSSIVVAVEQQDKKAAQEALQNLKQFKINQQREEVQANVQVQNGAQNILQIQASLTDFTTQYRQGQQLPYPKNAILELQKEKYIQSQLTSAYVYDMQKISVVKVFQEATESLSIVEKSFKLDQQIEIKISGEEVLAESLKNEHVLKNFKQILKKQQNWSNECQAFVKQMSQDINKNGYQQYQDKEIDKNTLEFIRLQEKLFLEKKRKELAEQFKELDLSSLDTLRKHHIDLKKTKIKKSKKNNKKSSFQDFEEELHSEIIQSIRPLDEMVERIQKEVATFSHQYTSIWEDTKFRLLNKATRVFNLKFSLRFTQRLLSRIFSYYAVVNGLNFYEKQTIKVNSEGSMDSNHKELKELQKLPPIKGSNEYFKEKYKEQRAISFQKGTPFLFNTYTLNEFDRKTQKIVQGLNFFDLEDNQQLRQRQKAISKKQYNKLQKEFTIYFYYLCKILMQGLMNITGNLKKDTLDYKLYDNGMYGNCVGYANRFEFQQRGTIHLHQLLFFPKQENGQIEERLLQFWAATFSLWNCKQKQKDFDFINQYRLEHECNESCIKAQSDNQCRKGYPRQMNPNSSWKCDYFNQINGRVQCEFETRIFMHDRDVVKFFGSSCIVEASGNDKIIDYITKYMNKSVNQLNEEEVGGQKIEIKKTIESESEGFESDTEQLEQKQAGQITVEKKEEGDKQEEIKEIQVTLKKQANDLIHKVLSKKVTSISEAYADLLDFPLFQTSFTCVKVAQVPLSEQFRMSTKTISDYFDVENPDQDLKTKMKQSIWIKYLCRPDELELLTLTEYLNNFLWYGGKSRYKQKAEIQGEKNLYLLDQNGQLVKEREKTVDIIIQLSQVYYLEDLDYSPNLFYLAMLQLFWPHRQEQWLNETKDTYEGFKQAYNKFYINKDRRINGEPTQIIQKYLDKFGAFPTFKEAVDNYKKLTTAQQKFLKAIQFVPKTQLNINKKEEEKKKVRLCKQFFTYHCLLRSKNSIIKLNGYLEQEGDKFKLTQEVKRILNYLRPDILISTAQKEEIIKVEDQLIQFVKNYQGGWKIIPESQKCILEELSALLKSQKFEKLQSFILENMTNISHLQSQSSLQSSHKKQDNIYTRFEQSSNSKIAQNEIDIFLNSTDNMVEFPEHFRTVLSRSEFKNLIRPRLNNKMFETFQPSSELDLIYNQLNNQQKLALIILLHYFYQSQVIEKEEQAIYEGCFIHGGGGVGKSFIIEFLLRLFEELDLPYYVLCPTQVAVQNISKNKQKADSIMTIHSFFHLQPHITIDSSYEHFQAFLRYIQKEDLFQNSTAQLYPELSFYNCMNKAERFTQKLKGVRTIILEEISMIPPKFLSLLDIYLQVSLSNNLPFGGIQIFAFGDSFQLQPVTQPPTYYFQSHVFKGNFFTTYLELTMPVRQASDQIFYKDILQPIRLGQFKDHENFKNSIRLLKMRHLNEKINNQTQFNLAGGLQMQIQRLQIENEITFLYFDNEAVSRENQVRADQHIQAQQLKYQDQKQQFRVFLNSPARLSFGVKSSKQDMLLINLSQDFSIIPELINQDDESILKSYALHFKLLPLTIRNYLLQSLLTHVYESARLSKKKHGFNFPLKIKLFKNAQIVFRKNLDKEKKMINGQAGIITDLLFDIDFKSEEMRKKQADKKEEKIQQLLIQGFIKHKMEAENYEKYELDTDLIKSIQEYLEQEELNNVNCFIDEDILESEKEDFIKSGVQPRLKGMSIKIFGYDDQLHLKNLEQYYKGITVEVSSQKIKGIAQEALQQIQILNQRLKLTDNQRESKAAIIKNLFQQNQNYIRLMGIGVLLNQFDSHMLQRGEYHLSQFISQLNEESTPMIITQMPLNLAYARTIHTSQGATFGNICVTLDTNNSNRPGLLYTAFSRVRNLQSLFLQGVFDEDIFNDNIPEELKFFFQKNFIYAEEILHSKVFNEILVQNSLTLNEVLVRLGQQNEILRKKVLGYLPKRQNQK